MTDYLKKFPRVKLDRKKLVEYVNACMDADVKYGLGSKDLTPRSTLPIDFKRIDCSGFLREIIFHASGLKALIPDGTWVQRDWFERMGYKESSFENTLLKDEYVRICFKISKGKGDIGHTWLTYKGKSYESHSGRGPGVRDAATPSLKKICQYVYVLD